MGFALELEEFKARLEIVCDWVLGVQRWLARLCGPRAGQSSGGAGRQGPSQAG
jgi:hypothetical protein